LAGFGWPGGMTSGKQPFPKPQDFPRKNRIMAAIRLAVFW
jgi:hypothetical protein